MWNVRPWQSRAPTGVRKARMRDLLVVSIVLAVLPFVFRHTWVGVMLWTWLSVMNPHKLAFGFATELPLAAAAAGTVLISLLTTRDKLRMAWSPPVGVLFAFVIWICLTTAFAFDPAGSWVQLNKILKIQLMTGIALMALHERKHIELFLWVNVLSVGFFGFKGGIFTILTGGSQRVWGPPGGFFEDNNACAVALIMVVPLMNFLRMVSTRPRVRLGLLVLMLLCAIAALGTQSRGGLLAISAMGLVLWYRSDRKMLGGLMILAVATALLVFMPDSWERRMSTIQTYEQDESSMGRLEAWQTAINVANHRPTGAGFAMYDWATGGMYAQPGVTVIRAAHSIYFSVLGEHGYIGLSLFVLIWVLTLRVAGQLRKQTRNRPEVLWVYQLAGMCQVALVGYLVGGTFLSLAYFDLPYNILVVLVVTQRWLRESGSQAAGVFGSASSSLSVETQQALK